MVITRILWKYILLATVTYLLDWTPFALHLGSHYYVFAVGLHIKTKSTDEI